MIPTPQLSLTPESAALLARAPAWPRALMVNLRTTLDLQNEMTGSHIIAKRMSRRGPETLGVVTSRLRSNVHRTAARIQGDGIMSAIGNNVRYMGGHEFGFTGTVQVKEHRARHHALDVFKVGRQGTLTRGLELPDIGRSRRNRKTQVADGFVTVRAHPMKMNIKERAPLRRGINDRITDYRAALSGSVVKTFLAA
jgi:hypothetical protein